MNAPVSSGDRNEKVGLLAAQTVSDTTLVEPQARQASTSIQRQGHLWRFVRSICDPRQCSGITKVLLHQLFAHCLAVTRGFYVPGVENHDTKC